MTKLLSMLTEPEYRDGKTIVILAGYSDKMKVGRSSRACVIFMRVD